jgi:hypothetical protein
MKRLFTLIAATAALGLSALVHAGMPADQAGAAQETPPAEQPTTPSTMPATNPAETTPSSSAQQDPAASAQSTGPSSPAMRLAAIAPAGMTAQEACTGFKSVQECATSLHAAQNLNIPFTDLKSKVTGGQKLGAAIKELKPDANVKAEVHRAEQQARSDTRSPQG